MYFKNQEKVVAVKPYE